jgi:hypothetical protein
MLPLCHIAQRIAQQLAMLRLQIEGIECYSWAGEVSSVLRVGGYRLLLRQWIAGGASCALMLQLLLSAVTLAHSTLSMTEPEGSGFVICHGTGTSTGQNDPGNNLPPAQTHCLLCTVANSFCAVLPSAWTAVIIDASAFLQLNFPRTAQVTAYHSPTGEYQRGPPTGDFIIS